MEKNLFLSYLDNAEKLLKTLRSQIAKDEQKTFSFYCNTCDIINWIVQLQKEL